MKPEDDDALRAALAEAHRGDAARRPSFERLWAAAGRGGPRHTSPVPWLVTCGSLAAAMGLAAWLIGHLGPPPVRLPTGVRWIGPTDFLLETPGLVTLRTVPELAPGLPLQLPDTATRRGKP